jgi:hypothetical protein
MNALVEGMPKRSRHQKRRETAKNQDLMRGVMNDANRLPPDWESSEGHAQRWQIQFRGAEENSSSTSSTFGLETMHLARKCVYLRMCHQLHQGQS